MDSSFPGAAPRVEPEDVARAKSPPSSVIQNPLLHHRRQPLVDSQNKLKELVSTRPSQRQFSLGPPKKQTVESTRLSQLGGGFSSSSSLVPAYSSLTSSSDAWVEVYCPDLLEKVDEIKHIMGTFGKVLTVDDTRAVSGGVIAFHFQSEFVAMKVLAHPSMELRNGSSFLIQKPSGSRIRNRKGIVQPLALTEKASAPVKTLYRNGMVRGVKGVAADRSFYERIWMWILSVEDIDE